MNILFCGLGSIGKRHVRLLRDNFPEHELYAFRSGNGNGSAIGVYETNSWDFVEQLKPDICFITNPTQYHTGRALLCAMLPSHVFVEKPVSNQTKGLLALRIKLFKHRKISMVGYNMRFHPRLQELKGQAGGIRGATIVCATDASKWPGQRDLNHVMLELSHELDYASWLFGPILAMHGYTERFWSNFMLFHEGGCSSHIALDMAADKEERYIVADGEYIDLRVSEEERDEMFLRQLEYFFDCVKAGREPSPNVEEATRLLSKILEFKARFPVGGN